MVPKYYYVPKENIEEEKRVPGSMTRYPSAEGTTDGTYMLGQSVYFISQLLGKSLPSHHVSHPSQPSHRFI